MKNIFVVALFAAGALGLTWATIAEAGKVNHVRSTDDVILIARDDRSIVLSSGMSDPVGQSPYIGFHGNNADGKPKVGCILAFATHKDDYFGDYPVMQVIGKNGKMYLVDMEDIAVMVTEWKESKRK